MNDFNPPYMYGFTNLYESTFSPLGIQSQNTWLARYFKKYLLQKAMSVYKWTFPNDAWQKNYFLSCVYCLGYISVLKIPEFGVFPQQCGLQGLSLQYQPTKVIVTHPLIRGELVRTIGKDCALIKMQPDYSPIYDIIEYFGEQLSIMSQTLTSNGYNSQTGLIATAATKNIAESYKEAHKQIAMGKPFVVVDKEMINEQTGKLNIDYFFPDVAKNFIGKEVLEVMNKLDNQFCTMVGIPNNNDEKKERQVVDEVNANNVETQTLASMWLENLQQGCKQARDIFGINLNVEWQDIYRMDKGGVDSACNNVTLRTV